MRAFYSDIIGLPILEDFSSSGITFFKIAEGYGGHTTVLAVFDANAIQRDHFPKASAPTGGASSTLHHLALTVDYVR
ncbi:MAG: hypothetical protein MK180_12445 [Rhodobacteraceae bacterium]|nr:hypothetical protein [Paracoccaceae bacterium]